MEKSIFITGGARSGKSKYALMLGNGFKGKKAFIATAIPMDNEIADRIERHKKTRSADWGTFEVPFKIAEKVEEVSENYSTIIIDCIGMWISNTMTINSEEIEETNEMTIDEQIDKIIKIMKRRICNLIIISNEVGWGIVPDNRLARCFRDIIGFTNEKLAEASDEVYLMASGIPLKIK